MILLNFMDLKDILEWLVTAEDTRQQAKAKHLMKDIIALVFFCGTRKRERMD